MKKPTTPQLVRAIERSIDRGATLTISQGEFRQFAKFEASLNGKTASGNTIREVLLELLEPE